MEVLARSSVVLPEACFRFEEPVSGTAGVLAGDAACLVRSGCWWRDSEEEKVDSPSGCDVSTEHSEALENKRRMKRT